MNRIINTKESVFDLNSVDLIDQGNGNGYHVWLKSGLKYYILESDYPRDTLISEFRTLIAHKTVYLYA
jgi:hypothetical protein